MSERPEDESFDTALGRRLARLAAVPVDTTRLDQALRSALPPRHAAPWRRRLAALAAVAASLIIVLAVALPLMTTSREVRASAEMMAQLHEDIVSGRTPTMTAESVADANRMIAAMSDSRLTLPGVPETHTMACCLRSVKDKQVACVLLKDDGVPVTMAVARASDLTLAKGATVTRDGEQYHVEHVGRLAMVSLARDGRFVCLIGAVPEDRLMAIGAALKF